MPQKVAIWLLVLNMGCGTVGTTIISPALSSITEQFSVDEANSQSLLSGYFISLAFFQLFYGVLSDRYGRRRPGRTRARSPAARRPPPWRWHGSRLANAPWEAPRRRAGDRDLARSK